MKIIKDEENIKVKDNDAEIQNIGIDSQIFASSKADIEIIQI